MCEAKVIKHYRTCEEHKFWETLVDHKEKDGCGGHCSLEDIDEQNKTTIHVDVVDGPCDDCIYSLKYVARGGKFVKAEEAGEA